VTIGEWCIFVAAILWACDGILRRNLYHLPALTIITLEHWIGFCLFFFFFHRKFIQIRLSKSDVVLIVLIALFSGLAGTLMFTQALLETQFISFSVVFLLQKLQPIFAIASGWALLGERPTRSYALWAALALAAAYFVTFPNGTVRLDTGDGTFYAALLAFGAAVAWGGSTGFSRKLLLSQGEHIATGLRFFVTAVFGSIALLIFGGSHPLAMVTYYDTLALFTIALSTGLVALFVYYRGLRDTPVRIATIIELTFPLLAVLIDAGLYHTVLAPTQYLAALVLLFAMYQVSTSTHATV
jgi:drug/metabolite transporter (DMT)-like permease